MFFFSIIINKNSTGGIYVQICQKCEALNQEWMEVVSAPEIAKIAPESLGVNLQYFCVHPYIWFMWLLTSC